MAVVMKRVVGAAPTRARRDRVEFLDIPERRFLAVDGCERPGGQTFQNAIGTLFPVAYTLHFLLRKAGTHGRVGNLEALYRLSAHDATGRSNGVPDGERTQWTWRLMIPIPAEATELDVEEAISDAAWKKALPAINLLHVVSWREGPSAQILHIGPYAAEAPTIAKLMSVIHAKGFEAHGPHHEIYLNDPHRLGEDRAKTLLRQAIRPAAGSGPITS